MALWAITCFPMVSLPEISLYSAASKKNNLCVPRIRAQLKSFSILFSFLLAISFASADTRVSGGDARELGLRSHGLPQGKSPQELKLAVRGVIDGKCQIGDVDYMLMEQKFDDQPAKHFILSVE